MATTATRKQPSARTIRCAHILKHRNATGRRVTGYSATIGPMEGRRADTPAAALDAARVDMKDALERLDMGTTVQRYAGHVVIVAPYLYGWEYRLVHLDGALGSTSGGYVSRNAALEAAALHAGQLARGRAEYPDAEILSAMPTDRARAELRDYFKLQDETAGSK